MTEAQPKRWWFQLTAPWRTDKLRQETLNYWHDQRPRPLDAEKTPQEWYIAQLLPQELHHAAQNHGLSADLHCDTLALLVGYSIEPLLQAVGVYEPAHVILLLHKQYGEETGEDRGKQIKTWLTNLLCPHLTRRPEEIQIKVISEDEASAGKPETVFRALCEHVLPHQRAGKRVVVDITGGKKSMDAGAFLFAAYADIPVSYVDADYEPDERRPWGFTCHIGELQNPYAAFRLRDWERVRRLYTNYHFRAAGETLREVLQVMREPAFVPEHIQGTQRLLEILDLYEAWDDGDYSGASQRLDQIRKWQPGFVAPDAIEALGPYWPEFRQVNDEGQVAKLDERQIFELLVDTSELRSTPKTPAPGAFFESNTQLLPYVRDELVKIQRLKDRNEDSRSALLRAAGLDELLLKARWSRLFLAGLLREGNENGRIIRDEAIYDALLAHDNVRFMRRNLRDGGLKVKVDGISYWVHTDPRARRLARYDLNLALTGEQVADLRNQTIHQYIPIPQSVAEAAYRLAKANLDDFVAHWATLDGQPLPSVNCVTRMEWDDVCRLCGLDFLPLWQKEQP